MESSPLGYTHALAFHGAEAQYLLPDYVLTIIFVHQDLAAVVLSTFARRWQGQLSGIQLGLYWRDDVRRPLLLSVHVYQYLSVLVSATFSNPRYSIC